MTLAFAASQVVGVGCSPAPATSNGTPTGATGPGYDGDPAAAAVLQSMAAAYRDATSYFDNAEYRESFIRQGEDVLVEPPAHQVTVAFERPNRVRLLRRVPEGGSPGLAVSVATDGQRLLATVSDLPDQVLDLPAPESLTPRTIAPDPALYGSLFPVPMENLFPQLDLLLATEDSPPALFASAEPTLLPNRELDGVDCSRVALKRPSGEYVLWIDAENHLLRRMEAPTDEVRRQLDPRGVMLEWRLWIDFQDATLGGTMADSVFQITPADGAQRVERFQASNDQKINDSSSVQKP